MATEFRPGLDHFRPRPPCLGSRGLTVSVGPIRVRVEGMGDALFEAALARYGHFLSDAPPLHAFTVHGGASGYLEPSEDRFLRLEQASLPQGTTLLSHDFAAWRLGPDGMLRLSRSQDPEQSLRAVENYLRWIVADLALDAGGFVLHAAGLVRDGRAHVFFGASGAGKSTVASMSPECALLSDDLVLLLRREDAWRAATTPFAGTLPQEEKDPGTYPLAGLYSLNQWPRHEVRTVESLAKGVGMVLACCPFVAEPSARRDRLAPLVEECCRAVRPCELRFSKDPGFWQLIA